MPFPSSQYSGRKPSKRCIPAVFSAMVAAEAAGMANRIMAIRAVAVVFMVGFSTICDGADATVGMLSAASELGTATEDLL